MSRIAYTSSPSGRNCVSDDLVLICPSLLRMHGKAVGCVLLKDIIVYVLLNCMVEIVSMLKQDVGVSAVCSLQNTAQRARPWARGFQVNTCTSDVCLQLGIFTELRSFSKPGVKIQIQLLIKWLKISFLHMQPCFNSFAALPPLPVDGCV